MSDAGAVSDRLEDLPEAFRRWDDPFAPVRAHNAEGWLERGEHRVFWQDSGAPDGMPVVVAHGGPGGANSPALRRGFDPDRYRIIQFDQRGCGRSERRGALTDNTLQHTIEDMERLREALGVERWLVTGGSWGGTVALAYAEAHPERCLGVLLVSLWLCRAKDVEWWWSGVRTVFPELWDAFAAPIPVAERGDLRTAYCARILDETGPASDAAASRLYLYEEGFMRFEAPLQPLDPVRGVDYGRIFAHYARHNFFLTENQLIENAQRLAGVPVHCVTGRYDMCTTPDNAHDLKAALGASCRLTIVPGAGHNPFETTLARACVRALDEITADITHSQPT